MSERRSRLAARFRKAVEQEQEAQERDAQTARQAVEAARAARAQLLADLESLARDIGFLGVERGNDGLTLRYQDRYVHFAPIGDAEVEVEFEGTGDDTHRLYREAELGHRWVHVHRRRRGEDRVPLFDQGIEALLVVALGLPAPSDEADEPEEGGSGRGRDL